MDEQKPNVKNIAPKEWFKQHARGMGEHVLQFLFGLSGNWTQNRDIVHNNYDLGMTHLAQGHLNDAIMRFRIVTWLEPDNANAWYYLGCSEMALKKPKSAQKAFRKALQYQPDNMEAAYMLAVAGGKDTPVESLPEIMPVSLVQKHFDGLAADYNEDQRQHGYQASALIAAAIHHCAVEGRIDHDILELGVGTGLCGPYLRDIAATITGVDISASMLGEARALQDEAGGKIYDALIKRELHDFLDEVPDESCDIIFAANVVGYIGELSLLFAQVARILKPAGLFALTADSMEGGGCMLDAVAGRFRFSSPYLQGLAADNGLEVVMFQEAAVYPNEMMWLCVFRK